MVALSLISGASAAAGSAALNRDELQTLESPTSIDELIFPRDEITQIGHWVDFSILDVRTLARTADPQARAVATIRLPIPQNLSEELNVSFDTSGELGNLGSIIVDAAGPSDTQARQDSRNLLATTGTGVGLGAIAGLATGNVARGAIGGMIGSLTASLLIGGNQVATAGSAAAAEAIGILGTVGNALAASAGVARNPHKVVLFRGVDFRTHNFTYDFVPKNYEEAQTIRKIIYHMKKYGSPSFGGEIDINIPRITDRGLQFGDNPINLDDTAAKHFFRYPNTFRISFNHSSGTDWREVNLFRLADCYLTRFSVNYHPANTPSYSRPPENSGKPYPTAVRIEMGFTETEILTREKVELGY